MSPRNDRRLPRRPARGLSLIEIIASLIVLSLVLAGFTNLYGTTLRHQFDPGFQQQALGIADAYLEEILAQPYPIPIVGACPAPAGTRPTFTSPCDYHLLPANGCTTTSTACAVLGACPCDRAGQPLDGMPGFTVAATVVPTTLAGAAGLRVRVDVSHATLPGTGVRLESFRTVD